MIQILSTVADTSTENFIFILLCSRYAVLLFSRFVLKYKYGSQFPFKRRQILLNMQGYNQEHISYPIILSFLDIDNNPFVCSSLFQKGSIKLHARWYAWWLPFKNLTVQLFSTFSLANLLFIVILNWSSYCSSSCIHQFSFQFERNEKKNILVHK